jgi:hypothetical protein
VVFIDDQANGTNVAGAGDGEVKDQYGEPERGGGVNGSR